MSHDETLTFSWCNFPGTDEHGRFAYLDPHTTQRALQPARRIRFWQNPHNVEVGFIDYVATLKLPPCPPPPAPPSSFFLTTSLNLATTQAFAQESTRPREGSLRVLAGEALDPTLALAFFFDGPESFAEFLELAEPFSGPAAVAQGTAMFSFAEFVCHGMDASDRQQHHRQVAQASQTCEPMAVFMSLAMSVCFGYYLLLHYFLHSFKLNTGLGGFVHVSLDFFRANQ